jgi:hypothetical protein
LTIYYWPFLLRYFEVFLLDLGIDDNVNSLSFKSYSHIFDAYLAEWLCVL